MKERCSSSRGTVEVKSRPDEEKHLEQHDGEMIAVVDEADDGSDCRFSGGYTDIVEEEEFLEPEGGEGDGMEGEEVTINWKKRIAMMESFEKMKECDDTGHRSNITKRRRFSVANKGNRRSH